MLRLVGDRQRIRGADGIYGIPEMSMVGQTEQELTAKKNSLRNWCGTFA